MERTEPSAQGAAERARSRLGGTVRDLREKEGFEIERIREIRVDLGVCLSIDVEDARSPHCDICPRGRRSQTGQGLEDGSLIVLPGISTACLWEMVNPGRVPGQLLTLRIGSSFMLGSGAQWSVVCFMIIESEPAASDKVPRYTKLAVPPDNRRSDEHAQGVCERVWATRSRTRSFSAWFAVMVNRGFDQVCFYR